MKDFDIKKRVLNYSGLFRVYFLFIHQSVPFFKIIKEIIEIEKCIIICCHDITFALIIQCYANIFIKATLELIYLKKRFPQNRILCFYPTTFY